MNILDNLQKSIFEIKTLLLANENIRKLVFYDGPDALSKTAPSISDALPHLVVSAIFDVSEPPFNKNTVISIALNKVNYDDELVLARGILKINVLTRSELWELNSNKIRPLELVNLIVTILNNQKTSSSHKISFSGFELAVLDERVNGYIINFFLEEGSGLDENF